MNEQLGLRVHVHKQPRVHRGSCIQGKRVGAQREASALLFLRGADHASTRVARRARRARERSACSWPYLGLRVGQVACHEVFAGFRKQIAAGRPLVERESALPVEVWYELSARARGSGGKGGKAIGGKRRQSKACTPLRLATGRSMLAIGRRAYLLE